MDLPSLARRKRWWSLCKLKALSHQKKGLPHKPGHGFCLNGNHQVASCKWHQSPQLLSFGLAGHSKLRVAEFHGKRQVSDTRECH